MQNEPSTKAVANDDLVSQNLPGVGDISLNIFGVASNESVTPLQATLGEAAAFGQYYKERHGLPPEADHNNYDCILEAWKAWQARSELVAAQIPSPHPDDVAVDSFAAAMKVKLALAREKGRSGWEACSPEDLSRMLREHVDKGDPRDVANFCAFLWAQGHGISAAHASQSTTRAAIDVLAERQRQSSVEGWTPEHDEMHSHGEIARAAACYALYNTLPTPTIWPWESDRWKPTEDHRRNLVRAGALILAEIERIDRVNVIKDLA